MSALPKDWAWHSVGYGEDVLSDASGRVRGRVSRGYRTYDAFAKAAALGEFVTEAQARRAVERAATPLDLSSALARWVAA